MCEQLSRDASFLPSGRAVSDSFWVMQREESVKYGIVL